VDRVDVVDPDRCPRAPVGALIGARACGEGVRAAAAAALPVTAKEDLAPLRFNPPKSGGAAGSSASQSNCLDHPSFANHAKLARTSLTFRIGTTCSTFMGSLSGRLVSAASRDARVVPWPDRRSRRWARHMDSVSLLRQVGVMPTPAAA
jgi:hypothetical protein